MEDLVCFSSEVFILLVINILNTGIGFIARDLTNALVAKACMEHMWNIYGTSMEALWKPYDMARQV